VGALKRLAKLKKLKLYEARSLESLDGIGVFKSLSHLEVHGATKLTTLSQLSECRGLATLEVSGCPRVADWNVVGDLANLEWLGLEDVGTVPTIQFLRGHQRLRSLFVTGRSRIADGNVAFLAELPSLRKVVLAKAAHLDIPPDALRSLVRRRGR
jgi:hypothetical protein